MSGLGTRGQSLKDLESQSRLTLIFDENNLLLFLLISKNNQNFNN